MAKVKENKVEEIVDTKEQRKKQIEEAVKKVKITKISGEAIDILLKGEKIHIN